MYAQMSMVIKDNTCDIVINSLIIQTCLKNKQPNTMTLLVGLLNDLHVGRKFWLMKISPCPTCNN